MQKYFIYGSIAILVAVSAFIGYRLNAKKRNTITIALVQPISHSALDEIVYAFQSTLISQNPDVQIDMYNGSGNRMLLQSTIHNLISSDIQCLITIGTDATTIAVQAALENELTKPICFVAAEPSEALQKYPYLTGVRSDFDTEAYCTTYHAIFPERKKILLAYDPAIKAGINANDAAACEKILQTYGYTVRLVPIDKPSSLYERILNSIEMHKPNTIMILMDNTVVSGIDSLIQLCNEYKILLYAADHNSTLKGAGGSYGHDEAIFGSAAANILNKMLSTQDIPQQQKIENRYLFLHMNHLHKQGVNLSQAQQLLIHNLHGTII